MQSAAHVWRNKELHTRLHSTGWRMLALMLCIAANLLLPNGARANPIPFAQWLADLWPDAEAAGVSRPTFDAAVAGLKPKLDIPDLDLPGRKTDGSRGQAEFTRAPKDYLDVAYLERLAEQGRALAVKHRAALDKIEREYGVDRYSILAIWGRETAFGQHKLPHDAIEVLATLAWAGRRKELFRNELIEALKMLEAGVARADMRASWAGAVGLTQFMPSEYFQYARDLDGDGRKDIFRSVPDALASAAAQLAGKGWVRGQIWGYEVAIPKTADCGFEGPTQARALSEWAALGFKRADGKPWSDELQSAEAYLMSPAGAYGPSFLVLENYRVIRRYNMSDLYAIFVGHLADRIAGGGHFVKAFGGTGPQKTAVIEEIQSRLGKAGYDVEKVDGKIGSNTRKIIGLYQRANGLSVDCWPSEEVLRHIRSTASR
jgi:lytic murein transglycosylase